MALILAVRQMQATAQQLTKIQEIEIVFDNREVKVFMQGERV